MKKIFCYIILMIIIVVLIPMAIIHFPSEKPGEPKTIEKEKQQSIAVPTTINVYIADQKKVVKMKLEDYLIGVVAAEMPASFEMEALKAQAVAARTYALGRAKKIYGSPDTNVHNGADVCTDPGHCQAWVSKDKAMKRWGLMSSFKYWNKICKAVNDTSGQTIKYKDILINPVFHSNSGGHTENSEDVWAGAKEPYLRSVASYGEDKSSEYENKVVLKPEDMSKKLKDSYEDIKFTKKDFLSNITILSYSDGGRVLEMKVGGVKIKGTDFRKLFELKSTNFKLEKLKDGKVQITTLGYGHGVGMSQCGANYLAQQGTDYKGILKYYYKDVEIVDNQA